MAKKDKFKDQECKACLLYPCFAGIEKCKSDFAKYACKKYKKRGI